MNTAMNTKYEHPQVVSIGTEGNKDCVVRVRMPDGAIIHASTNLVSFAKLAAAGIRVVNNQPHHSRKGS